MTIDREKLMHFIWNMEDKYPVSEWRIQNIQIWPLIRIQVTFTITNKIESTQKSRKTLQNIVNKLHQAKLAKKIKKSIINENEVDMVFLTSFIQRVFKDGHLYRKLSDPFVASVKKALVLEQINFNEIKNVMHFFMPSLFYQNDKKYIQYNPLYIRDFGEVEKIHLPGYQNFLDDLEKYNVASYFSQNNIIKAVAIFLSKQRFYKNILLKTKPKMLLCGCYYSGHHMACISVANTLKIPTIDIQHGVQGKYHIAYGNWKNAPKEGYDLLPKIFWTWDKNSTENIKAWGSNPIVFQGGNSWLSYWNSLPKQNSLFEKYARKINQPIILYTLQPNIDFFPEYLIKTIKNTQKKWNWCVRFHPGMSTSIRQKICQEMKDLGIFGLVEYKLASSNLLFEVLPHIALHITKSSSVVLEALEYNVPSLVFDKIGHTYYEYLLSTNMLHIYKSEESGLEDFIDLIMQNKASSQNKPSAKDFLESISKFKILIDNDFQYTPRACPHSKFV